MSQNKGYRVTMDRTSQVVTDINVLTKSALMIGIPMDENARDDGPIGNAAIGYMNEHGSAAANIPPRPFLVPGVKAVNQKTSAELAAGISKGLDNPVAMDKHLERAGMTAVASVKKHLKALGNYSPDSPTVKARRSKGFNGTGVLRVTGQLMNSITYVAKRGK